MRKTGDVMAGAQWVRIDVDYLANPKVRRAGRDGALLHLAAIGYLAAHELDDGLLPAEAPPVLAPLAYVKSAEPVIARLAAAGLWHPSMDGGYVVHDYDAMNGSRSEAAAARRRKRAERDRSRLRSIGPGA